MHTQQKTKIIATIGPASDAEETIKEMIAAGMSVARINLSFGTDSDQAERVARIRRAATAMNVHVAIMADTRGIEIRTGKLESELLELKSGSDFAFYCDGRIGTRDGVSVSYAGLYKEVDTGTIILLDDGAIELAVIDIENSTIHGRIIHGGILRQNKGVNLPDTQLSLSAVSPENREDVVREMSFSAKHGIEYVAASFIQTAEDIHKIREIQLEFGSEIPLIAKIENRAGVKNLEEIVEQPTA